LYLLPILDLLLAEIPSQWHAELRLGLQEALVNAAKHGNRLDPNKTVLVRFFTSETQCWWVISDQGTGFKAPTCAHSELDAPCEERDCGRGLYILHQIFDQVKWNSQGTELSLCKRVVQPSRAPFLS
jgi:anti-sigma regulatory factor (Ser/Thr protein kinase)